MTFDYEPCGNPGRNKIDHCIEPKGHDGPHTYCPAPYPDKKLSDELQHVKELLIHSCPDYMANDIDTLPKTGCCFYHDSADVVRRAQFVLRVMNR